MDILTLLLKIMIAFIIGTVASKVSPLSMPGSWAGAIFAGFIGNWIGMLLIGSWGPMLIDFSLVPALIGAFLTAIVVGGIAKLLD
ncbi:GlsB/YeaQ/YmgE family stress response membrane protein [Ornithinibacillus xuwenensis]|uniref:GlsB/YeaQ/YmgE family stress response membrane protein n=1 Tax=Ornithinibacillus xuwenensis TaxID=3144668 RepID=A0ABU9XH17_9BACI